MAVPLNLPDDDGAIDDHVSIFDSVNPRSVPRDGKVFAGYVDGRWPSYYAMVDRFPNRTVLPITTQGVRNAAVCDCEAFDLTFAGVLDWLGFMHKQLVTRPAIYVEVGRVPALVDYLEQHGRRRATYKLWTAHWTGVAHICGDHCGMDGIMPPGATQWINHVDRDYDESISTVGWVRSLVLHMLAATI